jgi:hypothetical protein
MEARGKNKESTEGRPREKHLRKTIETKGRGAASSRVSQGSKKEGKEDREHEN